MIEMQYNFPLLAGQSGEWKQRLAAAVRSLSEDDAAEIRPTFRSDIRALTEVAAKWMRLPAERTYLTEGGHHGSLLAMLAMGLAGKTFAIDVCGYTGAIEQAKALGAHVAAIAVDAEGTVAESLRAACEQGAREGRPVAAMYVTPTVHNPLGCTAGKKRRKALVDVARKFDLKIIEDAAYEYLEPDGPPRMVDLAPERTFYVRGLSKSYAPGTRTGFMVAPEGYKDAMGTAIKNTVTGGTLPHALAAVSAIADGTVNGLMALKVREGKVRQALAREVLGDANCWVAAEAAWHVWLKLPQHVSPKEFAARVERAGALISAGDGFAAGATVPHGCRIGLGGEVERERVAEGLGMVAGVLGRL